jgi:dTDP-4-amino-4,6-dideoxygalactose transaminase
MIRLSKSTLTDADKAAVMLVLDKEYLGMGTEVNRFENSLEDFIGRPVVNVSNGTAALHLALQACGIGPGDEVLVQSLTYVASFQAITATGARAIACDIKPETLTIDLRDARRRLSKKTKAIMPVHYAGGVGNLTEIYDFAQEAGLRVIEDAAHAFGTIYENKKIGSFGDICCFSFDGIKNITSGEGGCIVTEDEDILSKIRDSRLLGVNNDSKNRYKNERSWEFDVSAQGWRYHMSDIMAAIGLQQLSRFPVSSLLRQSIAKKYDEFFHGNDELKIFKKDYDQVVPHLYPIQLGEKYTREIIRATLLEKGIQTGIHYQPNHLLSFFKDNQAAPYPVTEDLAGKILSLPLHLDLSDSDVAYIANQVNSIVS